MTEALSQKVTGSGDLLRRSEFRLGEIIVSPGNGTAEGPGGLVQLDPRVMEVLACLAGANGEVVSKDQLMQEVWGNVIVTDFALSRCIYQLRKHLSRAAQTKDSPIETLPKRGYRLTWSVDEIEPSPKLVTTHAYRGVSVIALSGLIVLAAALLLDLNNFPWSQPGNLPAQSESSVRLAIYPLDDLSQDNSEKQFALGLARELVHELARLPGLTIMGRTSSFGQTSEISSQLEHASHLGVNYALSGSVMRVGSARRLLLQLHEVPSGKQLWSHSFLVEQSRPLDVFREVAWITSQLLEFSIEPVRPRGSTDNVEAFELYLAALETDSLDTERMLLQRAVEIDPEFANAWITLASIEVYPVWVGEEKVEDAWQRAKPYLDRALEIDPDSPWAYVELGRFKREFRELDEAIRHFRKALELDPGNVWASANLGLVLRMTGQFEEALVLHEHDVAMDPLDAQSQTRLGTSNWFVENFEEAERRYQRAIELNPMDEEIYDSWSGMLGAGLGCFDEALVMMERKRVVEKMPSPRTLSFLANLSRTLGLQEMTETYLRELQKISPESAVFSRQSAVDYLEHGAPEMARLAAEETLELASMDETAHLVLAILDLQGGKHEEFLTRVNKAYSDIVENDLYPRIPDIEGALLVALALEANDQHEDSVELLHRVQEAIDVPLGREHIWLAAAYAMLGDKGRALAELRASPPGRVRSRAGLLLKDPRFQSLHDVPQFIGLVEDHLTELDRQRVAYLSNARDQVSIIHPSQQSGRTSQP